MTDIEDGNLMYSQKTSLLNMQDPKLLDLQQETPIQASMGVHEAQSIHLQQNSNYATQRHISNLDCSNEFHVAKIQDIHPQTHPDKTAQCLINAPLKKVNLKSKKKRQCVESLEEAILDDSEGANRL